MSFRLVLVLDLSETEELQAGVPNALRDHAHFISSQHGSGMPAQGTELQQGGGKVHWVAESYIAELSAVELRGEEGRALRFSVVPSTDLTPREGVEGAGEPPNAGLDPVEVPLGAKSFWRKRDEMGAAGHG